MTASSATLTARGCRRSPIASTSASALTARRLMREANIIGSSSETNEVIRTISKPAASTLRRRPAAVYRRTWNAWSSCALQSDGCCGTDRRNVPPGP